MPEVPAPFAVLLNADEPGWRDDALTVNVTKQLLELGARYFVCAGMRGEVVHDRIDDVVVQQGHEGVVTTFHGNESKEEVAAFFLTCATSGMKAALVVVENPSEWVPLLERKRSES
jgi:hypothetical protein